MPLGPAQAQREYGSSLKPVLAIVETPHHSTVSVPSCGSIFEHEFTVTQRYHVLPLWHVQQQLVLYPKEVSQPKQWPALLQKLQSDYLVLLELRQQETSLSVIALVVQRKPQVSVIFADFIKGSPMEQTMLCESMARRFLGTQPPEALKSPALAVGLSFIMPGMGHFYLGKPINYLLGSLFFGGYATLAYLALTNETLPVSREQWGAMLLALSLTDTLTAYFFAYQQLQQELTLYE